MHVGQVQCYITYVHEQYLPAHVNTLYKLTYCTRDMQILGIFINNTLHVEQVPLLVYIPIDGLLRGLASITLCSHDF